MGDAAGGFILCFSARLRGRSLIYSVLCSRPARVGVQGQLVSEEDQTLKMEDDIR